MPDESSGEKTEDATPHRRRKERERGRTAQSRDLAAASILLGSVLFLRFAGFEIYRYLAAAMNNLIEWEMGDVPVPYGVEVWAHVPRWFMYVFYATGPFVLCVFVIGIFGIWVQTGPLFAVESLRLDLNKVNPVSGFQNMFSLKRLMVLVMNTLKLLLVVTIAVLTLRVELPDATRIASLEVRQIVGHSAEAVLTLAERLAAVFFLLGVADYLYQRYQFEKDIRMTKEEIKQEMKDVDGNPQIKQRQRQIQRQMAMQRMMQEVPEAEVVVRNPTHLAVAIRLDGEELVPVIAAKGADKVAERIIKAAIEAGVPTHRDKPLARQLFKLEIGDTIPQELYHAVIEVLMMVLSAERRTEIMRALEARDMAGAA